MNNLADLMSSYICSELSKAQMNAIQSTEQNVSRIEKENLPETSTSLWSDLNEMKVILVSREQDNLTPNIKSKPKH